MIERSVSGPLLRNRSYLKVWSVGLLTGVVRWLEFLAFGLFALDATGSPSLVAMLVILRFLPLAVFGVIMGALSDMTSPRRLLIAGLALIGVFCAAMFLLFRFGAPGFTGVALAAFLSGVFWAGDLPVRRRMIGDAVTQEQIAGAMALDGAANNGMRLIGPLVGGVLYQAMGIEGVFALAALLYAAAIAVALTIDADGPPPERPSRSPDMLRPLRDAVEAFRYARRNGDVMRILMVTVIFNIWGFPYLSMIPVVGRETLGLSASSIGALTAIEGLFALLAALAVAKAQPRWGLRALYLGVTVGLFLMVMLMGIVPALWLTALGLAVSGTCTAVFAAMQSTLIYVVAPPAMRGRFLGLMTICIGTGVLGFANIGLTAEIFGASNALWIVALEGLVPAVAIALTWTELRRGG